MSDQGTYRPLSYFQLMEVSLRELLVEKGIFTDGQVRRDGGGDAPAHARARRPRGGAGLDRCRVQGAPARERHAGLRGARHRSAGAASSSSSRTPPRCTTPSSARCVPAIRACCSACRPSGTSRGTTVPAWCASRAPCSPSSACRSRSTSPIRVHDSSADMRYLVLPMRPRAPRAGARSASPPWSAAMP